MKRRLFILAITAALSLTHICMTPIRANASPFAGATAYFMQCQRDALKKVKKEEKYPSADLFMLCGVVQAEAGNQGERGQRLVTDVILNRVESERYPDTISGVLTQKYQFSTMFNGAYDKWKDRVPKSTRKAVMKEVYADKRLDESILFFTAGGYNTYCRPAYKYRDHYFGY